MPDGVADSDRPDRLLHRDNTFGTPEEDAFRRDFTINALFYDIGTFSIIDYTGGLRDLHEGVVRSIGDPIERFQEDPVRMLRAVAMAARLGFRIDSRSTMRSPRIAHDIARSAPARLMEEFYKLLRSGAAEQAFRMLAERRLLEPIAQELQRGATERLWESLAALDAYRRRFDDIPGHADECRPPRVAARSARPLLSLVAAASTGRRAPEGAAPRAGDACRFRGATSSGCARSSACSGG